MEHYHELLSLESTVLYCMDCSLSACFCNAEEPDCMTLPSFGNGSHWKSDLSGFEGADNLVGHC